MDQLTFDDTLSVLGTLLGVIVVLIALGTLLGQPWSTAEGVLAALVQVLGILATIAVGVLVVLIAQDENPFDYVPSK